MCRIPGAWHDSSTVNIIAEDFCQHRKRKKALTVAVEESSQPLLKNRASDCWWIMAVAVEELCQWLLKNHASDCWTIVVATVEQSCQWLLNNRASDSWIIVPATVEESCQSLLHNCAGDCWTIVPVTVEALCQWLLNNRVSDSSTSKCPRDNVCSEIPSRVSSYHTKSSQLISIRHKLAGFSEARFLLKCVYEQSVVYVRKCF